ncbi:hypothetical protein CDL12_25734 [Handroanthus impetiginosus]|uniref:Uncharacterized protein n=1 Tax=Handroanthus impetiginosus TaxID=429701 RepID=A0A2G9G8Y5_9LAMI|nr:hypothetical protein CDL12_25734 [Handroanthus impetiginosus]
MSTWQIFSDSGNNFRWEISDLKLQQEDQCDAVAQQDVDIHRLPSMADLLLLGCSKLVESGKSNLENPPMFRTGLGRTVAVKQSSLAKARSVLGDIGDALNDTGVDSFWDLLYIFGHFAAVQLTNFVDLVS